MPVSIRRVDPAVSRAIATRRMFQEPRPAMDGDSTDDENSMTSMEGSAAIRLTTPPPQGSSDAGTATAIGGSVLSKVPLLGRPLTVLLLKMKSKTRSSEISA